MRSRLRRKDLQFMSRAINLNLSEADAREQCSTRSIGISAIEALPDGGVRLVCMSSEGAALLRRRLKSQIISDTARRTANSTRRLPW
jgi:hypothetical protein